jgi:glycosyltransferase involved in cell wall biosynthesis
MMESKKRLAIITTHPIQYNAPLFALLKERNLIEFKVFYTWGTDALKEKYDPGFGKKILWDIDLLKGYDYVFLENIAKDKGSHHFNGIDNPEIIDVIKEYNPQAILVYGWPLKSHYKVMRYFKGTIPVIFRGDSHLLDHSDFLKAIIKKMVLKWVYRHVDKAFYVGQSNYQYYLASGLKPNQLFFAPHAIDNQRFSDDNIEVINSAKILRASLGISENDLVFLFAGKLENKKDPFILLNSFVVVAVEKNIHLVFVGNGELESQLKISSIENKQVHFINFCNQSEMPGVYQMADVFVLPSVGPGESWGLAVNEAMANGKAIIVSDKCGCAATLVKEGVNGFVFQAGNQSMLELAIKKLIEDKKIVEKMKIESKKIIADYNFKAIAEAIEVQVLN